MAATAVATEAATALSNSAATVLAIEVSDEPAAASRSKNGELLCKVMYRHGRGKSGATVFCTQAMSGAWCQLQMLAARCLLCSLPFEIT